MIPKGWKKLNPGDLPKRGDKKKVYNLNKDGFNWRTLGINDKLHFPVGESEIIIRKEY